MKKYLLILIAVIGVLMMPHFSLADTNYPDYFQIRNATGGGGSVIGTPIEVLNNPTASFIYQTSTASGGRGSYTIYNNAASSSPVTYMPDYTGSQVNGTANLLDFFQGTGCCTTGGGAVGTSYWSGGLVAGNYTIIYSSSRTTGGAGDCVFQGYNSLSDCLTNGNYVEAASIKIDEPVFSGTIALTAPTSSAVLQNFQNWTTYVTDLPSSTIITAGTYGIGVWYSNTSSSIQNLQVGQGIGIYSRVYLDTTSIFAGSFNAGGTQCTNGGSGFSPCYVYDGGNNFYQSIPKFTNLSEGTWYAIPYLYLLPKLSETSSSVLYGAPQEVARGSMVSFTVSSTAPLPAVSTSTNLQAGVDNSNTSTIGLSNGFGATVVTPELTNGTVTDSFISCLYSGASSTFDIWNGSDWQCLITNTAGIIANRTKEIASNGLNASVSVLKNVFPLSLIVNFNQDISKAAIISNSAPLQDVSIGNGQAKIFGGRTYTFYSATTTRQWCQNTLNFDCRGGITNALYALTGIIMLSITFGVVRSIRHQSTAT